MIVGWSCRLCEKLKEEVEGEAREKRERSEHEDDSGCDGGSGGGGDLVTSFYMGHGALHTEIVGLGRYRIVADVCVSGCGWIIVLAPSGCGAGRQQGSSHLVCVPSGITVSQSSPGPGLTPGQAGNHHHANPQQRHFTHRLPRNNPQFICQEGALPCPGLQAPRLPKICLCSCTSVNCPLPMSIAVSNESLTNLSVRREKRERPAATYTSKLI